MSLIVRRGLYMPTAALGSTPPVTGIFLADDFAGTAGQAITTQTNETPAGGTWTLVTGSAAGSAVFSTSGTRIRSSTAVPIAYVADDATPADADYTVTGVLNATSLVNNAARTGVGGRWSSSALDGYVVEFVGNSGGNGSGVWRISKYTAGTYASLASTSPVTLTLGQNYTVVLTMSGSTISGTIDGAGIGSPVTDTDHSAAGLPAVVFGGVVGGGGTGTQIDSIQADN